ncbi:acyltransferase family protein [Pseudomonas fulva]|uniref:Acyltransferase 3 n=1 Tax=Pseudomonas fulva (strain 12-X) TaxID=743720 RepID=F6AHA9_PSEF1|nr:acyltransferase [Pseudomonas fulva]AEF23812.1 acyltransferase 3 [Pseudomonas fulva 12-X]
MQNRNLWVDYAKAIGILLVVYGHVVRGLLNGGIITENVQFHWLVDSIIYTFHMPLFFFLSGLFFWHSLNNRGGVGLFCNKIDTIFYPFVLWSLLQGTIEAMLSRYTNGGVSMGEVLTLLWSPRAQFWFLYALFAAFCLAIVLYRRFSTRAFLPLLVLSTLFYLLQQWTPRVGVLIFLAQNFVFFALGIWFNQIRGSIESRASAVALVSGLAFVVAQYVFHGVLGLTYIDRGAASLVVAFIGILFTVSLCMVLARRPMGWMLTLGALSMPIFLMHILAGSGARVILNKFLGINDDAVHIVVGCLAGVLLPVIAAKILEALNITWLYEMPKRFSVYRWQQRRVAVQPAR